MLDGLKVVELGTVITAPLAAMILADLGAEVIKVESPTGDPFRRARGGDYGPNFAAFNRNKRGIVLDLRTSDDRDVLLRLLDEADVLLDNFRPGVLDRLALGEEQVRARCPTLIHCSITGFGTTGPYSGRPAFDAVTTALSGISSMLTDPDDPRSFGPTISDNVTGMYAVIAILAALAARHETGAGSRLEVNMLEASMSFIPDAFVAHLREGQEAQRFSRTAVSQSFVVKCRDGKLLALHLSAQDKFWDALTEVLEDIALRHDPAFSTRRSRIDNYVQLQQELSKRFQERTSVEWAARLVVHDVPFASVNAIPDVLADPQVQHLNSLFTMDHPRYGSVPGIQTPFLVNGRRPRESHLAPPALGEHSAEVRLATAVNVSETK